MRLLLTCLLLLVSACTTTLDRTDRASDLSALQTLSDTWLELYKTGDFAAMQDLYEPDAWLMTRDRPARKSRDAILTYFEGSRVPGLDANMSFEVEETQFSGDHAYQTSLWWFDGTLPDGRIISDAGRSFLVYKQGGDGKWRIWRDIDNHTPDAAPKDKSE